MRVQLRNPDHQHRSGQFVFRLAQRWIGTSYGTMDGDFNWSLFLPVGRWGDRIAMCASRPSSPGH
jgi:hypothetical protein